MALSMLTRMKAENNKMLSFLNKKRTGGVKLKPNFEFPFKTSEELDAIEKLLKIEENYNNLVVYLMRLGRRDTSKKVNRILKTLFADSLAKEFNFYGRRSKKRPFCKLLIRNCIVEAVKNVTNSSEKEIEDKVKIWLKHAPERQRHAK